MLPDFELFCGTLLVLDAMKFRYRESVFHLGTVATLVCNLGFTPAGAASSTCTNGVWAPPTPGQCIRSTGVGPGLIGEDCQAY